MKINLEKIIRDDVFAFRYYAKHPTKNKDSAASEQLSDNLYVLECRAKQVEKELKQLKKRKGSDVIPGLFEKCRELCKKGILPDENGIIDFFEKNGGLSGKETAILPLIVTCSLIDFAAHSVRPKSKTASKQLANSVISLRKMSETDFEYVTEKLFKPEKVLLKDNAYSSMDECSKNSYRKRIAYLAFKSGKTETEIAELAFEKAEKNGEHIGKYLFSPVKTRKRGYVYLVMEVLMPLAVSFCISVFFQSPLAGVLTFFPLWELLRYPIEAASLRNVPAKGIIRFSVESNQVANAHALITVSVIMPPADKISELENHLEQLYLSNCTGNIKVCCLADFKGAGMPRKPEDKTMIKAAKDAVDRLNRKYSGGFILAVRPRVHSETQNEFIGRERKRGAITELVRAIKGSEKGFSVLHGDTSELKKVKYLIALDADTGLVFDSARELIAVAEHPLNRPVINNGRVTEGFGILVPKTEVGLMKEDSTLFELLMAGDSGISSYDSATGERYRDLFGESIFCGKGLIDVDTYYSLLDKGLPNESILSHDIIESCYLRTGYVSQAQITEDFPQTVLSYFRRLHRWVRGDWQNIRFIFGKNPLGFISRYKMFDNLRRSATPVLCLAAIIVSLFLDVYVAVCITLCALFALSARNIYSALRSLFHGGLSSLSRRYYSKAMPYGLGCFIRGFADIAFSARESAVCLDAIFKALWRLFVSKKNLLEWTTAAQSEGGSLKTTLLSCIPSMAVSFLLFMLGNPVHRLAGLIILADIPLSIFTSSKIKLKHGKINGKQREKLISYAAAMWGFFEDLCGKENNFLPPDNIQFSPVKATANRTSPTNIGLMLASFLSARDMGFITTAELYMRMNLSLASVEKLEKYEGNLLNWYSTLTLQPLTPRFVSTVDSGNFLCCLTAVKEGLREYIPECPALEEIINRIEKIISETSLKPLYNEKRKLFHIGLDPDTGEKSNSFYDLYMSEARMTAYFAVAKHEVSKKHWGALGRVFVGSGRFTGLASWTGTMFEYFMPNLFVPAPYGSLSREALYFCLHCQKKRAGRLPFGISESGFYAFDRDLNYQYKAHGVKKLALNSRQGTETVISPYSTFLALTEAPSLSLGNLEKLEKSGMNGIYGLYEAVDYSRRRSGGGLSVVRSYMAHHVGMSMVAVNNIINGSCMQERFMRDKFMKGAASLLEERIPTDADIYKGIRTEGIPNIRERVHGKNTVSESPNPFYPEAMLLSNGRMTVCITDCGTGVTLCDGMDITVNSNDLFNRPQGIFGVFAANNEVFPFVNALERTSSARYKAEFFKDKAEHTAKNGEIRLKMKTTVLQQLDCELREFTVENLSRKNSLDGNLIIYFEPCIEKRDAYSSHPMFSKLFLIDEWDEDNRCVLYSRRSSSSDNSCGMVAGIIENADEKHETSRERVLKSPFGIFSLGAITEFNGGRGNPDCCCAFSIKISLKPGEKSSFTLAVAVGENKEKALDILLAVRAGRGNRKLAVNPFFSSSAENSFATKILPRVLTSSLSRGVIECGERCNYKKGDLWSFGISGENPIITVDIENKEETDAVIPYIRINKKLRSCGIKTDLAVIFDSEDKYALPVTAALKSAAEKEDCGLMIGVGGGIHFIDKTLHSYNEMNALRKSAVFSVKAEENASFCTKTTFKPLKFIDKSENNNKSKKLNNVKQFNFTEGKISIKKEAKTLDIPWTMVYANRSFGTIVSDKALGFTWFLNSRENKLTPWYNDLMSDNRGEMLIMKYNNILYDLISLGEAEFTPYSAVWKTAVCGIEIIAEISVACKGASKKCNVRIKNNSGSTVNFDLMYYVLPVLGVSRDSCGMLHVRKTESGVIAENPFAEIPGFMFLGCNGKSDYICLSQKDFREGNFSSDNSGVIENACLSVGKKITLKNGEKERIEFVISAGVTEKAVLMMPSAAIFGKMLLNPKKVSTNKASLDLFFNSFLYSQVKQSRFFGRTGFYQCSGAYGFRDQLQDCLAFLDSEPELTRTHIARCAAVQFEQGDVLHWWHVIVDKGQVIKGIRTRCSDDLLWLPYVCIKYREKTGDTDFLDVQAPYLTGEELTEGENERYFTPKRTVYRESILNHCIKAVDRAMNFGKNGLPLIGSCDWNDGFSRIGESKAESVWLAMFLIIVLEGMSDICNEKGLAQKGKRYSDTAAKLRKTVEEIAWCGDRYARIILENGKPLYDELDFIDVLPQAFSVFAGLGKNGRAEIALNTALERLYDGKTVRLLSPPFDEDNKDYIGYIASYPQGIRENGGQYTHAAVWLAYALFKIGKDEDAEKLINSINPMSFYTDDKIAKRYRAEPYVLAGDVSYGNDIDGRAGWTHFTGSAAWFYRCVYENYADKQVKKKGFTNRQKQ
ncbi:MAG: hypothetical protein IJE19_05805 [Clostridia bacterium]|nr:hypothetical protein [Clostridia bacterium]